MYTAAEIIASLYSMCSSISKYHLLERNKIMLRTPRIMDTILKGAFKNAIAAGAQDDCNNNELSSTNEITTLYYGPIKTIPRGGLISANLRGQTFVGI